MGKIAIIINGDSEPRHVQNVERAVQRMEEQGFETYVASTTKPQAAHDHYFASTERGVDDLLRDVKSHTSSIV